MNRENCPVCSAGAAPSINEMRAKGMSIDSIAKHPEVPFGRKAVRAHFRSCDVPPFSDSTGMVSESNISIEDAEVPLNSDAEILFTLGIDPEKFVIVGGTNVSARTLASGDMLYSYRAKIQPVEVAVEADFSFNLDDIRRHGFNAINPPIKKSNGSAYVLALADPQLGKSGTGEAVKNLQRAVIDHVYRAKRMMLAGVQLNEFVLCYMGDEIEGIAGNYANQTATVELNLSQQLELDFELRIWAIKYIIDELSLPMQISSVISNHGDSWVRMGGSKPIMGQSDNASTHVARQVEKAFALVSGYDSAIDWHIARDEPSVILNVNGIKMYTTHGYLEKGAGAGVEAKTVNAMQRQILGNPMELGDVKVFLTAHYHHYWAKQEGVYTVIGCPALESRGSSKWLKDMNGVWSEPGAVGFLVGQDYPLGWNELAIL